MDLSDASLGEESLCGAPFLADPMAELSLTDDLSIEDHGSEFYLIARAAGCDLTFSIEAPIAFQLADFITKRRAGATR